MSLELSDFDYCLPESLIAQAPSRTRDHSRLLVLDRTQKSLRHRKFCDIITFLNSGDLLVLNNTKVVPARIWGRRQTGGRVEILLMRFLEGNSYQALIKPLGRLKVGEKIELGKGFSCRLIDPNKRIVEFDPPGAKIIMEEVGVLPLPPYIRRKPNRLDKTRYQTVFASRPGAIAAPTAGLHFTKRLLDRIRKKGVGVSFLTLHVNYATFSPVRSFDIRAHQMEEELYEIPEDTVKRIREVKKNGGRVFCVGTTCAKALETSASSLLEKDFNGPIANSSKLFIYPPFNFKIVDALITNFHLPRTTLLMLISAFAGRDTILRAYKEAVQKKYRFYSYGDAMLIM